MVESGKTNLLKKQIQVIISCNFHSFPSQVSKIPFNHPHVWLLASKITGDSTRSWNHPNPRGVWNQDAHGLKKGLELWNRHRLRWRVGHSATALAAKETFTGGIEYMEKKKLLLFLKDFYMVRVMIMWKKWVPFLWILFGNDNVNMNYVYSKILLTLSL